MRSTKYYITTKLDDNNFLLVNTLSGAMDVVENSIVKYLENMDETNNSISNDVIENLIQRGYVVQNDEDYDLLEKKLNHITQNNNYGEFVICPTFLCNLRCSYCFEDLETRTKGAVLDKEHVDNIFEGIRKISKERKFTDCSIRLYGGEPFQNITKEIVEYICELAKKENYKLSAITNGTNIEMFLELLNEYRDVFNYIQITVDGTKEIHDKSRVAADGSGSFDKIIESIGNILDLEIPLAVRVNTGRDNFHNIPTLIDLFKKLGWTKLKNFRCQLAPINDHYCTGETSNWMPEDELLNSLYSLFDNFGDVCEKNSIVLGTDIMKRTALISSIWDKSKRQLAFASVAPCSASLRNVYVFGSDNLIYACPESVGKTDFSIGTFYPEFYIDKDRESMWERNVTNINKCRECNIVGMCGTPCTWASLATNGNNFIEPVCNYAQGTVSNFLKLNKDKIFEAIGK